MSVTADRSGSTATVTIVIDVADILALTAPLLTKRLLGLARAEQELKRAMTALATPDAQLDQSVTDLSADVTATKAARPTGTF
jgi:hypothetical protein